MLPFKAASGIYRTGEFLGFSSRLPSLRKVPILRVTEKKRRKNGAASNHRPRGRGRQRRVPPSLPPEVATADSYAERRRDGTAGPNLDVKRAEGGRHETDGRSEGGRAEVDVGRVSRLLRPG